MLNYNNNDMCVLPTDVGVPIELYKSLQGKYFIGYADNLAFGENTGAWARLYNPRNSRVNLFVNVWTVTDVSTSPFRAQFWFNADPPGLPDGEVTPTPSNTAIIPAPVPKIILQYASLAENEPTGGTKAFVRRALPETTLVESENGKLIFPPGGSFLVYLSNPEDQEAESSGRVAFGWWEEKVCKRCVD